MTSDLVSVVIPVYNSEKYLEECLNSVLGQTHKDIEIIAVDDGSEDSSLDILKKYSDKVNIFSQKNQGLAIALNLGISKMKGNWLKWFSPDDVMFTNTIEKTITRIRCSIHEPDGSAARCDNNSAVIFKIEQQVDANLDIVPSLR